MKHLFSILMIFALAFSISAQDTNALKSEINKIKKDKNYIYEEITGPNRDEALILVEEVLRQKIQEYVEANRKKFPNGSQIVTHNLSNCIDTITMPRANMFRAFAYVKKSDIFTVNSHQEIGKVETPATQPATQPVAQPKPELSANRKAVYDQLLAVKEFSNLKGTVEGLKQKGYISNYDKYSKLEQPEQYVLIIYDQDGNIRGLLSDGEQRINLKSGQADEVLNYKGCAAIGLKVID